MSNDKAQASDDSEVAAMTKKQMIERSAKDDPAPAAAPPLPPWTAAFDLPSIRSTESTEPKRD